MDPLVVLLIVVTTILTVLLVIVGVQVILILKEVRKSLTRVNETLDSVDKLVNKVSSPFTQMGGLMDGVKSGFKVAEAFVGFLKKNSSSDEE